MQPYSNERRFPKGTIITRMCSSPSDRVTKHRCYEVREQGRILDDFGNPMTPTTHPKYWAVNNTETKKLGNKGSNNTMGLTIETKTVTMINGVDVETMDANGLIQIVIDLAETSDKLGALGLMPKISQDDLDKLKKITQDKIDSEN